MREKRSYDQYYDNKEGGYVVENVKKRKGFGLITVVGVGVIGYLAGYRKARATAKTILDTVFEKYPDHKTAFQKVWNVAVDEYFDKK